MLKSIMVHSLSDRTPTRNCDNHIQGTMPTTNKVADILEQESHATIADWLMRVNAEPDVVSVRLTSDKRIAHLPEILRDIVVRLRNPLPLGTRALISDAATEHGIRRREQGYSPAMIVEESRMLQVSIFHTLKVNIENVEADLLLVDVMTIADEVDSQLAQAMTSYPIESVTQETIG